MEIFFSMCEEAKEFDEEPYIDIQAEYDKRNDEVTKDLNEGQQYLFENINNESIQKKSIPTLASSKFIKEDFVSNGSKTSSIIKASTNIENIELQKTEMLNKKRNISNDKGKRKDNIFNRIKNNFFKEIQIIVSNLIKNNELYRTKNIILKKIKKDIYKEQKAIKNLYLLDSTLKDVLSMDEDNKVIIDNIIEAQDYPLLIEFLDKTIKELMYFYSDKCKKTEVREQCYLDIIKSYENIIKKLEDNGKPEEYISKYRYYSSNIEEEFIEMNKHAKGRK